MYKKYFPLLATLYLLFVLISSADSFAQCNDCPANQQCSALAQEAQEQSEDEEFEDFDEFEDYESGQTGLSAEEMPKRQPQLIGKLDWILGILLATVIAGIFVRFGPTRKLKYVFLIASVIILGFYRGACPCMLSSFMNVILAAIGVAIPFVGMLWFLGLVVITYFFGQVWCGWVCHLGALQEFLHKKNKFKFLQGEKALKLMHIIRYVMLAVLIVQLLLTQTILFNKIDPFKVAYNLTSYYTAGWILLGILIIASIFINRPFCKAACPVGMILGWVSLIPGASVIGTRREKSCKLCYGACDIQAIRRKGKQSIIDNRDCYLCGDCMESCPNSAIKFKRKSKENPVVSVCGKNEDMIQIEKNQNI